MKEKMDYIDIEAQIEDYLEVLRDAVANLSVRMDELQQNLSQARSKVILAKERDSQLLEMGSVHILG